MNSNRTSYTDFEFKQKFYSNKYLLQFLNSTNFNLSLYIYNFNTILITSRFTFTFDLTTYHSFTQLVFYLQLHSNMNPASEQSAKINIDAVKLKRKYFCSIKQNMDFENNICLSYLGCSSSFNFQFIIHEQLVTYTVYHCICHKAMHTNMYT